MLVCNHSIKHFLVSVYCYAACQNLALLKGPVVICLLSQFVYLIKIVLNTLTLWRTFATFNIQIYIYWLCILDHTGQSQTRRCMTKRAAFNTKGFLMLDEVMENYRILEIFIKHYFYCCMDLFSQDWVIKLKYCNKIWMAIVSMEILLRWIILLYYHTLSFDSGISLTRDTPWLKLTLKFLLALTSVLFRSKQSRYHLLKYTSLYS